MNVNHLISNLAWSRSALSPSRRSERFLFFLRKRSNREAASRALTDGD